MNTLTNEDFIFLLKECCTNGKIDDDKLNNILKYYFPYNLTFGKKEV